MDGIIYVRFWTFCRSYISKNPRSNIKFKDEDGKYKTKGKSPGVYIDVENGKVIEFDGNVAVELKEYSALLK